eukprot:1671156-Amphidinium_carterae.1
MQVRSHCARIRTRAALTDIFAKLLGKTSAAEGKGSTASVDHRRADMAERGLPGTSFARGRCVAAESSPRGMPGFKMGEDDC